MFKTLWKIKLQKSYLLKTQATNRLCDCVIKFCSAEDKSRVEVPHAVLSKYQPFKESHSPIILDVEEERRKFNEGGAIQQELDNDYDEFYGISHLRGIEGVFELGELVDILRRENARDLFVADVPQEYKYVRHVVIVHGKSTKHMLGMAEFVRKVFKFKRNPTDVIPRIEGKGSKDWIALDLGNIALHIFSKTAREYYDLESLWTVGDQFDKLCNTPDDSIVSLLKQNPISLTDLTPADK